MNEKVIGKRQAATIKKTAHRHLKYLSWQQGKTINDLIDDALCDFLKRNPPMPRNNIPTPRP